MSGIIWRGRPYRIRKLGQEQTFILVTSLPILVEVTRVLREYFEFSDELAYEWFCRVGESSDVVTPQHSLDVVPDDPDDNKFIECALEGRANFIVTRDSDLLRLNQYQSIEIVDDEAFLAVIVK